jgi:hypothetical protein
MVVVRRFIARILVLTEDGHPEPLRALVRSMLRLVDPSHDRTHIDVQGDHPQAQEAATGNLAKGRRGAGHKRRVEIARAIATEIFIDNNFVFYHVDADQRWSAPRRDVLENVRFYESIHVAVRQHLDALRQKHGDQRPVDAMMNRVRLVLPYYSIEAWLLQNIRIGRDLCQKHHRGQHVSQFDAWEQNRGALDEVEKPKEVACLDVRHYVDLACKEYPSQAVYAARKSFAESADRLKDCEPLKVALAGTRGGWRPPEADPEGESNRCRRQGPLRTSDPSY